MCFSGPLAVQQYMMLTMLPAMLPCRILIGGEGEASFTCTVEMVRRVRGSRATEGLKLSSGNWVLDNLRSSQGCKVSILWGLPLENPSVREGWSPLYEELRSGMKQHCLE